MKLVGFTTDAGLRLGVIAGDQVPGKPIPRKTVGTADQAQAFEPRPYALALAELGVAPADCLFVAGSAYDLYGAASVGMPVFWHDRIGMEMPPDAPPPLCRHESLRPLTEMILGTWPAGGRCVFAP